MPCYPGISGVAFPHVVIAAAHHVCEGGFILVAILGIVALGTGVGAISMGPTILGDS